MEEGHLPSLRNLKLAGVSMEVEGMMALGKSWRLGGGGELRVVDVSWNQVSKEEEEEKRGGTTTTTTTTTTIANLNHDDADATTTAPPTTAPSFSS